MVILGFTVCTCFIYEVQTSINLVEETKEVDDDVNSEEDANFGFNEDMIDENIQLESFGQNEHSTPFYKPYETIQKGFCLLLIKPPLN